jgi:hypothetical protein
VTWVSTHSLETKFWHDQTRRVLSSQREVLCYSSNDRNLPYEALLTRRNDATAVREPLTRSKVARIRGQ